MVFAEVVRGVDLAAEIYHCRAAVEGAERILL